MSISSVALPTVIVQWIFLCHVGIFAQNQESQKSPIEKSFVQLSPFTPTDYRLRSGPILVVNENTFFIPNLHFDGQGLDAHFWVGYGNAPTESGILVSDENGLHEPMKIYNGQNVYISLPRGLTMEDIDYLAVWDISRETNFGHVSIPKSLNVPKTGGILLESGKRIIRVQKCCPLGQVLTLEKGCSLIQNANASFEPSISVLENNETHLNDEAIPAKLIKFEPFTNKITCARQSFPLIPGDDQFWLLSNGSLISAGLQKVFNFDDFCFESVDIGNSKTPLWKTTAFICFPDEVRTSDIYVLYSIGLIISVICLTITVIIFSTFKEIRDARGVCIIGYAFCLAVAFTFLSVAQLIGVDDHSCYIIAYLVQCFLISSFLWLMMIGWETHYKIINYSNNNYSTGPRHFCVYILMGLVLPVIISFISYIIDHSPDLPSSFLKQHYQHNTCFFDQGNTAPLFFYGPIVVTITITLTILILSELKLIQFQRENDFNWRQIKNDLKALFRACALIASIVTFCWFWEIVSYFEKPNNGISIAIDFITCLQGVLVLVVFALHRPAKDELSLRLKKWRRKANPENSTNEAVPLQEINGPR